MKTILRIGFVVVLLCLFVMPIQAQTTDNSYELGSVWSIGYAKTKPGQFDKLMNGHIANVYTKYYDEMIKDGTVLSYKILSVTWPRDNEPNIIFLVEFKNWATFDSPPEYWEGIIAKVVGSLDKATQASIDREELRTLRGSLVAEELLFKK